MFEVIVKFFSTFGLVIIIFVIVGRFIASSIKISDASIGDIILDLFDAFSGNQNFDAFNPIGKTYIAVFMYMFKCMFLSLLCAMIVRKSM